MKNAYIATVGKSVKPILDGFRIFPIDMVHLLHSDSTKKEATEISQILNDEIEQEYIYLHLINPFELGSIVTKVYSIVHRNPDTKARLNMTGGTNLMTAGMLLAGIVTGSEVFYIKENMGEKNSSLSDRIINVPIPRFPLTELSKTERDILRMLATNSGSIVGISSFISSSFGLSGQLASYYLKKMEHKDLVEVNFEGRVKRVSLTETGELLSELF